MTGLMNRFYCIVAVMAAAFCSCDKDDGFSFPEVVSGVTLESTDNALRVKVNVTFRQDCEWNVTVWPSDDESARYTTSAGSYEGGKGHKTLMFLYPETQYSLKVNVTANGSTSSSETMTFRTSSIPSAVPSYHVLKEEAGVSIPGYMMQWQATDPAYLTFCDTDGRVVWYEKFDMAIRQAYFDPESGRIAALLGFRYGRGDEKYQRLSSRMEVIDLEGNRIVSRKTGEDNLMYPHHDIRIMPDGNLLLLNNVVKNVDLTALGGGAEVPVFGEGYTIMTPEGETVREWDLFGELDFGKDSYLEPLAYDYDLLHANSINWDSNGDYYMTLNRYSELWKIDGKTGKVLYKLSSHGNVSLDGRYPEGGLHAAVPLEPDRVLCFENGGEDSRSKAVIYRIDPSSMTARQELDVAIPSEYSSKNRSNVELICDGKILMFSSTIACMCVFTDLDGSILKIISRDDISYRANWFGRLDY